MLAVAKAAGADQLVELDKARFNVSTTDVAEAEFANPWRVDQFAATRKVKQAGRGGGVRALTAEFRQWSDAQIDARQQAVNQRRLTHPGLANKNTDVAV